MIEKTTRGLNIEMIERPPDSNVTRAHILWQSDFYVRSAMRDPFAAPLVVSARRCSRDCEDCILVNLRHERRLKFPILGIVLDNTQRIYPDVSKPKLDCELHRLPKRLRCLFPWDTSYAFGYVVSGGSAVLMLTPTMAEGDVRASLVDRFKQSCCDVFLVVIVQQQYPFGQ
jgi:hypothetical protein